MMNNTDYNAHKRFDVTRGRLSGSIRRLSMLLGVMVLVLVLGLVSSGSLPTANAAGGPVCYTVADSSDDDKNAAFNDVLALIDLDTGLATFLGQSVNSSGGGDIDDIEATEFDPDGGELFAIDDFRLGTLNQLNAEFTVIGELGTCNLSSGSSFVIDDADGLAKDYASVGGDWYGAARVTTSGVPDYLFKLPTDVNGNPTTPIEPNAFGSGVSCVPIPTTGLPGSPDLIDDLGFDPVSGQLYGVANGGATTPTRIVKINKADGSVTDLGQAQTEAGVFIPDIEGFSIDESGQWLLSTGQDGNSPSTDDSIFTTDPPTGPFPTSIPAVRIAQLRGDGTLFNANDDDYDPNLSYEDWEAITCYNVSNVTASLGDYTWIDSNGDGIQDGGEPPAPGVSVTLYGTVDTNMGGADDWTVGTTETDANGFYQFPLPAGNYYLEFDSTLDYTTPNQGGDPALDSDPDSTTGLTDVTTLDPGENDETWDAGLLEAAVGDYVWLDTNGDGIQDSGEPGVEGIEVKIYDPGSNGVPGGGDDVLIDTTTTDENGLYGFTVQPGDYFVEFDPTQNYTLQNQGGNDALDSDPPAGVGSGQTPVFTVAAQGDNLTLDAGLAPATLGDFVWADLNGDGIQDGGEPGVAGVEVQLFDPGTDGTVGTTDDVLLDTTTTDGSGAYGFSVVPGDYYVRFDPALDYTLQYQESDPTVDSDADPATGRSGKVTLAAGQDNPNIDAGLINLATIGDKVWDDANVDGIQDGGEPGVSGVTVKLFDPGPDGVPGGIDDVLIDTTTTAGDGTYSFTVIPGDYYVEFTAPAGESFSPAGQGANPAADSDADVSTGQTVVTTLAAGENDTTWDAGLYTVDPNLVAIGNIVWVDTNDNGTREPSEPGIEGVTIYLYLAGATPGVTSPVATTTTDANGRYLFPNVPADVSYFVAVDSGDPALAATPYSAFGGDHPPDAQGDHIAPSGDDGTYFDTSPNPWVVTQDFTVTVAGQTSPDIEDPVNILDASAYMTIDFGFTATPTAISLGQFTVQTQSVPPALVASVLVLLALTVAFITRTRLTNIRA